MVEEAKHAWLAQHPEEEDQWLQVGRYRTDTGRYAGASRMKEQLG